MKIVHVICSLCTGGAELLLLDIIKCQQQQGHDLGLVVINNRYESELCSRIPQGVDIVFVNRPEGSRNPWWLLKYNIRLRRMRPDIIHFHHDAAAGMTVGMLCRTVKVATVHDTNISLSYYPKLDKVFAISDAVAEDVKGRYGLESDVVYNGIPDSEILSDRTVPHGHACLSIVQISRLDAPKKGQDLLIKAVSVLRADGYDISVDFIGEGPSEDELKSLAEKLGVGNAIRFLGRKPRAYIYQHLHKYNLLVQPSRYEGFGLTVAEGMAAGVPVLVSDIEGPMEVIGHGRYGHSFRCGSADSLAETIKRIYDNYDAALTLARGDAYEYCLANFSVSATARNYICHYKSFVTK